MFRQAASASDACRSSAGIVVCGKERLALAKAQNESGRNADAALLGRQAAGVVKSRQQILHFGHANCKMPMHRDIHTASRSHYKSIFARLDANRTGVQTTA